MAPRVASPPVVAAAGVPPDRVVLASPGAPEGSVVIENVGARAQDALDEGSSCPEDGCSGILKIVPDGDCSCHVNPPCQACEDAYLECDACGWEGAPGERP